MKRFFVFAMLLAIVATVAQANNPIDTIAAGKVSNQPVHKGKVVNIIKGDSAVITGVDSVVVVAKDTTKDSEKIAVYADGKLKFTDWVKEGYTSTPDPADTTGQKVIITAVGGDDNGPGGLPVGDGFIVLMIVVGCAGGFGLWRWLR